MKSFVYIIALTFVICVRVQTQSVPPNCADYPPGSFVNNEDGCIHYWFCENDVSEPIPKVCNEGTSFNPESLFCETPDEYECHDTIIEDPPRPPGPPETPSVCAGKANGYFVNNPTGCRSYFSCVNEIGYPQDCPVGFNFNEDMQACDDPSNTPCSNSDFRCPQTDISSWEYLGSCTKYHFCFGGQHSVFECGPGLHFSSSIGQCTFVNLAECTREVCPPENDINNIVTYPSKTNCEEYSICFNGVLQEMSCDTGIHWNQRTQKCEKPEDANCQTEVDCSVVDDMTFLPHPYDCSRYFICYKGIANSYSCIEGYHFNPIDNQCQPEDVVMCSG